MKLLRLINLLEKYRELGFLVSLLTPSSQDKLALNPNFFIISRDSLETPPNG